MPRVLLCCEGVTDQGRPARSSKKYRREEEPRHLDGPVQKFMRACAQEKNIDFVPVTHGDIKNYSVLPKHGRRASVSRLESIKIAGLAAHNECTHIAYHMDVDNKSFEVRQAVVLEKKLEKAAEQDMKCLAIVPQHTIESWLLCDESAFPEKPENPALPRKPEELWGDPNDPESNHPKRYLERVLAQFGKNRGASGYAEIASKSSLDAVREKCPLSFGRFCDDLEVFLEEPTIKN